MDENQLIGMKEKILIEIEHNREWKKLMENWINFKVILEEIIK